MNTIFLCDFFFFSDGAIVSHSKTRMDEIKQCLDQLQDRWPQFKLDGDKNVWIVKPGAKSRGRGESIFYS